MKLAWKLLVIVCLIAAGGGYYWWKNQPGAKPAEAAAGKAAKAEGKGPGKRGGGGPVAVRTVQVSKQAMPQVIDVVGTVESEHSVAVRPQVNGVLTNVLFKEGERVKAGQPLFRIDPDRAATCFLYKEHPALPSEAIGEVFNRSQSAAVA